MTAISITAGSVKIGGAGAQVKSGEAAETITQGQVLYKDVNLEMSLASRTDSTKDNVAGIALTPGGDGDTIQYISEGPIYLGGLTQGLAYFLGTDGGIIPQTDLTSGNYVTYLGIAADSNILDVKIHASGTAKP